MKQSVRNNPAAIGFISNYQVETGGLHAVNVENVPCAKAYVNTYPGVARFYEVTRGPAKGAASWFISWIDHSRAASSIIRTKWLTVG